jgi:hypothetical protein
MQSIYSYTPETEHVSRVQSVAAVPYLQFVKYGSLCTGLDRPWGFQEVEAPRCHDSRHMKVTRLWALPTGRLYLPGNILIIYSFLSEADPNQGHSAAGRTMSMKNYSNTFRLVAQCFNQVRHRVSWSGETKSDYGLRQVCSFGERKWKRGHE